MRVLVAVLALVLLVGPFAIVIIGSRRYEARQRRLGRWDKYGPLVETEGPRAVGTPRIRGGWMNERLEVIGAWHGRILRRRKPNEMPDGPSAPLELPRESRDLWNRKG